MASATGGRSWSSLRSRRSGCARSDGGGEVFLPAEHFGEARVTRVMPLDAWAREHYGDFGWVEEFFERTFDTDESIARRGSGVAGTKVPRGWRFTGDVRTMDPAWVKSYAKRVREFARKR